MKNESCLSERCRFLMDTVCRPEEELHCLAHRAEQSGDICRLRREYRQKSEMLLFESEKLPFYCDSSLQNAFYCAALRNLVFFLQRLELYFECLRNVLKSHLQSFLLASRTALIWRDKNLLRNTKYVQVACWWPSCLGSTNHCASNGGKKRRFRHISSENAYQKARIFQKRRCVCARAGSLA